MIEELADILLERRIDDREDALAAARAILERLAKPSEKMLEAGAEQLFGSANDDWKVDAGLVYAAMLSAIDEKEVG